MKNRFLIVLILFCFSAGAQGATPVVKAPVALKQVKVSPKGQLQGQVVTVPSVSTIPSIPPVQPQPVDFGHCSSLFKLDSQKLFYLTLASANANRFKINEIQSKSGYVLFTVAQRQFLASVISIDAQNSMLKITPCDNVYYFPVGIVQNMFKYIELNLSTPIEKLVIL